MSKKSLSFILFAALLTLVYVSCKKADEVPAPLGPTSKYYPLERGKYVIYNVDSTRWDDTFCVAVKRAYQIMHTVADTFTDNKGRLSYRINTRIRKKATDPWEVQDVIYVTNTGATLEMAYANLRFIKLTFPVKQGNTWKGNSLIPTTDPDFAYFDDWDYTYDRANVPYSTGEVQYENAVEVSHVDRAVNSPDVFPNDPASRTFSREVYAPNVGMVYREYVRWTYDPQTTKCRKGAGVIMRAVDHN